MPCLSIHRLPISATIGAYDWEQQIQQTLYLDLELELDILAAAKSDQLEQALDYAALASGLTEFVQAHPCRLLEALVAQIHRYLSWHYPAADFCFTLTKPHAIPGASGVSLKIKKGDFSLENVDGP